MDYKLMNKLTPIYELYCAQIINFAKSHINEIYNFIDVSYIQDIDNAELDLINNYISKLESKINQSLKKINLPTTQTKELIKDLKTFFYKEGVPYLQLNRNKLKK